MKTTVSTIAVEVLVTHCNPLTSHTHSKFDGGLISFSVCISQSLVAPGVTLGSTFSSPSAPKYFLWIIISPNHIPFQLLISAESSRCLDSSSHMLLQSLCADISAAPAFLYEASPSHSLESSTSFGRCLYIICKYLLARDPLKLFSSEPWDAYECIALRPPPTL